MTSPEITDIMTDAETVAETYFETIKHLAALPLHEYERCRKEEAKRLEMRTSVLDNEVKSARPKDEKGNDLGLFDPEPWPEEVDGDDLLDRIVAGLRHYVVMPPHAVEVVALWCVHAHVFEAWQHTPRLAIGAPEKACGKSLLLDVIAQIVPRALQTDSLSEAVAFRLAESHKPVFLIDECDTHLASKNPDDGLRGILNSGHAKGKRALRCVGDDNTVKGFNTFTPVALAGIGSLPATLADRSIRIVLRRRRADERVQDFRSDHAGYLHDLASQAARWTADRHGKLAQIEPAMPPGVHNRMADNWRPLLAIADLAGGEWPKRAREAVLALSQGAGDEAESIRVQLLGDIRAIFETLGDDRIASAKLAEHLHQMEDRRWPEHGKAGKPISVTQIARLLKPFAISTGTIRWGAETAKGYKLNAFQEAFSRYLPLSSPVHNVTTSQVNATASLSPIPKRHNDADVTFQNPPKPTASLGCDVVTAGNGGWGDKQCYEVEDDPEERAAIQEIAAHLDPEMPEFLRRT